VDEVLETFGDCLRKREVERKSLLSNGGFSDSFSREIFLIFHFELNSSGWRKMLVTLTFFLTGFFL
jgi:hypothetical protein